MATRDQILDNSIQMFLERGCKSLTMDDIASENGVSKRTLYELFEDKSTLLEECMMRHQEQKSKMMERLSDNSENVLEMFLKAIELENEKLLNLHFNFITEVKRYYPEVFDKVTKDLIRRQYDTLRTALEKGQQEGVFVKGMVDVNSVAVLFITLSKAIKDISYYKLEYVNPMVVSKEMILLFLRGYSTPKGIEIIDNYINNNTKV